MKCVVCEKLYANCPINPTFSDVESIKARLVEMGKWERFREDLHQQIHSTYCDNGDVRDTSEKCFNLFHSIEDIRAMREEILTTAPLLLQAVTAYLEGRLG